MRLITDEKLIKRNAVIGRVASLLGLAVLFGGLVINFTRPGLVFLSFGALLFGFLLSNVGIYYANRWVRPPRPDQALDAALKGLDDRYTLYHYRLGASHALISPAGVFALVPKFQAGEIGFDGQRGRWSHRGGNLYLKLFGQDRLGNPSAEAATESAALANKLEKLLPGKEIPPIQAVVVFTNDKAQVDADAAPIPTLHARKLKAYLRSRPKGASLSREAMQDIDEKLGLAGSQPG